MNGRNPMDRQRRIRALDERREQLEKDTHRRRVHLRRRLAAASLLFLFVMVLIGQSYFSKVGYVTSNKPTHKQKWSCVNSRPNRMS